MYPILILRSELVCLIILVFLHFTSRSYHVDSESRTFGRILHFSLIHVVFDIITVVTVNHMDLVPAWLNWLCHIIFYLSAILYSNEIVNYVVAICYPRKVKKLYAAGHLLTALYICCLSFLRIEYVEDLGTYSSAGPAAIVGYGLAFLFFIIALVIIFTHMKKMSASIKSALIPMMLVLMITEICQVIWRSVLFTGGAITIVTVGFFFSLENPVAVFQKKAMTDALTGVRSRSSYEEDLEKYDRRFRSSPNEDYIFVLCDLNDLREVNNRLGHAEGDNYITLIASALSRCMKHAFAVYRIGGDEFLVLYYRTEEETVEKEIRDLQTACAEASADLDYTAGVSAGYARSSATCGTLRDAVKTADYAMYQNKAKIKNSSYAAGSFGTRLNYAGLTDKLFDAMCASNDRNYPFVTNLDTNVTRIAAGWKDYFGLDGEFYADFVSLWMTRIHPDHVEGYMEDVLAVINGHRKYHNYDYLARKADGEYVWVSCHGSMYQDKSTGSNYFSGFMVNHGMDQSIDPVTGLNNFDVLAAVISRRMDEGKPFSVLKLKLNNMARVNMLYGYGVGNEMLRSVSGILRRELGNRGEVFCQGSVNFTILFETDDAQVPKDYYRRVSDLCAVGVETEAGLFPMVLSGGAIVNRGERCVIEQMRSGLVFALEESHSFRRNKLVFYNGHDSAEAGADISMLSAMHTDALGEMAYFRLRYQPIVELTGGRTVGAEALLRWIHPVYGEVCPRQFIAFLENDPCYYRLGLHLIEQAVRDAKQFRETVPGFRMNINITALQLQNECFADDLFGILEKEAFAPDGLVLELTERCKEMDNDFLAAKIAELRSRGVPVAFDDLGTGYSTINLLMNIPVDEIKLDRDFVQDIGSHESYRLFVRTLAIGSASPESPFTICFEGIETEAQLEEVRCFGDFLAQGYYFSEPLLKDGFIDYIQ